MHLFTVTICTNFFIEKYSDEFHEKCALEIFKSFKNLMIDYKAISFEYEVFWRKGCVITDIVVRSTDENLHNKYAESESEFKKSDLYHDLLKYVEENLDNHPEEYFVNEIRFKLTKFRISRQEFKSRGIRLKLTLLL